MKRLLVFGSTGSVGQSVLSVVREHADRLAVRGLAAFGSHPELLLEQIREFRPEAVAVTDRSAAELVEAGLPSGVRLIAGETSACDLLDAVDCELMVAAMAGVAGLPAIHEALAGGRDVAVANKEPLVVAGGVLRHLAERTGARLIPVDSEHAGLQQALVHLREEAEEAVRRLVLTASGGPFRERPLSTFAAITPEEALEHPTWSMGEKITVDSATLMNKGLEVIEAHHLFGVSLERIEVVIHPQSTVHAMVEFRDGTWLAQLAPNDMVFPIQYALSLPERWENDFARLEPARLGRLDFSPVDAERFPAVEVARQAFAAGESGPAVLSGANEVAVRAFLDDRISFPRITELVEEVLGQHQACRLDGLDSALHWDAWAREAAESAVSTVPQPG